MLSCNHRRENSKARWSYLRSNLLRRQFGGVNLSQVWHIVCMESTSWRKCLKKNWEKNFEKNWENRHKKHGGHAINHDDHVKKHGRRALMIMVWWSCLIMVWWPCVIMVWWSCLIMVWWPCLIMVWWSCLITVWWSTRAA